MRMPWGKFRGEELADIPLGYLCWVWEESGLDDGGKAEVRREVLRRLKDGEEGDDEAPRREPRQDRPPSFAVEDCIRRLVLQHHPDRGGDHRTMCALNEIRDVLRRAGVVR